MTRHMTHVEFTDVYAQVPLSDDAIGAWQPLSDDQRHGWACLDCGRYTGLREIGRCNEGPITVCAICYIQRLKDHVDYYRPTS